MSNNHDLLNQVDACVARIFDLGCAMVYRTIERMDAGEEVPEVAAITGASRLAVLEEIRAVMAVYDTRDGGHPAKWTERSATSFEDRLCWRAISY